MKTYYQGVSSKDGDDRKKEASDALAVLNSGELLLNTPFVSPSGTCNNWEEGSIIALKTNMK